MLRSETPLQPIKSAGKPQQGRFACTGAGWAFRPVHTPNTSLSTHTFCCSSCCSGFDFLPELQVSSTMCTCSIFGISPPARPGVARCGLGFLRAVFSAHQDALRGGTSARRDVWRISPCYLCCLRIVKISALLWASVDNK